MKRIVFLLLSFCATSMSAQNISEPGKPYDYYCEVYCYKPDSQAEIWIGDARCIILDDEDNPVFFASHQAVITYMSKRGWSVVFGGNENNYGIWRVFMKKQVTDDKQAFEHLNLGKHPYKKKKK